MKNKIIFKTLMLKGEAGSTILSMEKTGHVGTADIYTITFNDGSTTEISLENMSAITSVEMTSSTDTEDIYTITCADGSTQTFSVLNHNADIAAMSDDIDVMSDNIDVMDARLDNFLATQTGVSNGTLRTETTLFSSTVPSMGNDENNSGYFDLEDSVDNYDEIVIRYSAFSGKSAVVTIKPDDIPVAGGSDSPMHWSEIEPNNQITIDAQNGDRSVHRFMAFTAYKFIDVDRVSIDAFVWGWNGSANSNGVVSSSFTKAWNSTNGAWQTSGFIGGIYSITGIKYEEAGTSKDPELADLRVGADGVTYASAGESVRSQVSDLKGDLNALNSELEEIDSDVYLYGKNVFPNNVTWVNGTLVDGEIVEVQTGKNDAVEKEYIPVTAQETWTISWKAVDLTCRMYIASYNENLQYIGLALENATMNIVTRSATFTTPENCAYVRVRIYRTDATYTDIIPDEIQLEKGSSATEYEPKKKTSRIALIDNEIEEIQEGLSDNTRHVMSDVNLLENLIKGYLKNDGTFNTTTSGWYRSDYIPVTPDTFMYFWNINQYNFFGFFDATKTWLGGKDEYGSPVTLHNETLVIHTVPAGAAYMIVSLEDTKISTCWGNYTPTIPTGKIINANTNLVRSYEYFPTNPCDYEGMDVCTFRKGICIGDSITGGGFNYSSGTNPWSDGNVYSYPSQFNKMTGIDMTNEGHSGLTSVQWWDTYGTGGEQEIDFSGYDFAIIHLGINDVSYSVDIEDTETAYQNIIDALKTANTGIKIFVCTIIPAYADAENQAPYSAVNTLIKSFTSQVNVYCCDLTTYGHEYTVSEYTAGHLTAYGYWRMAKDLIGYIGSIMRQYPAEFRFIQFIGTDMVYTQGQ